MAKSDLLKEAIADARTVKETALANAKIALQEAFRPRLESMFADKLSEELEDDEMYEGEEEEMDVEISDEPTAEPAPAPEMAPEAEPAPAPAPEAEPEMEDEMTEYDDDMNEYDDLDLEEDDVEAKTKTIEIYLPPKKDAGKVLQGELQDQVKELVSLLHTEAKVI